MLQEKAVRMQCILQQIEFQYKGDKQRMCSNIIMKRNKNRFRSNNRSWVQE
jgi:hypothetical protein